MLDCKIFSANSRAFEGICLESYTKITLRLFQWWTTKFNDHMCCEPPVYAVVAFHQLYWSPLSKLPSINMFRDDFDISILWILIVWVLDTCGRADVKDSSFLCSSRVKEGFTHVHVNVLLHFHHVISIIKRLAKRCRCGTHAWYVKWKVKTGWL